MPLNTDLQFLKYDTSFPAFLTDLPKKKKKKKIIHGNETITKKKDNWMRGNVS